MTPKENNMKYFICNMNNIPVYVTKQEYEIIKNTYITQEMMDNLDSKTIKNLSVDLANNMIHIYEFKYRILKENGYKFNLFFDVEQVMK